MSKVGLTEIDILKNIVKDQGEKYQSSLDKEEFIKQQRELCKLYLKIWSASTKFIKSQCDKGRLVDTMYFGMFFKADSPELQYVHIPHSDILVINKLKLKQNEENLAKVPPQLENISGNKVALVQANLRIGVLTINKLKEIEFSTLKDQATLNSSINPSYISKVEMSEHKKVESNLTNLQQNQMNKTQGSPSIFRAFKYNLDQTANSRKQPSPRNSEHIRTSASYNARIRSEQASKMGSRKGDLKKETIENNNKELNEFLEKQKQTLQTSKDGSVSVSPMKKNNYIIEQLYKMKKNNATADQIREKAINFYRYQPNSQTEPNSDLPQISKSKKTPKHSSTRESMKQVQSKALVKPPSQQSHLSRTLQRRTSDHGKNYEYQASQYGNTLNHTVDSVLSFDHSHSISKALDRKQISPTYHQDYPQFLRSNGPFKVYNHHKEVGFDIYDSLKQAKKNATSKVQQELNILKARREFEKQLFQKNIQSEAEMIKSQYDLVKQNNVENSYYLKIQMEEKQRQKIHEKIENNQMYKTSFGPEETEELLEEMKQKRKYDQMVEKRNLINQMLNKQQQQKFDQEKDKEEEKVALDNFSKIVAEEEKAKQQKVLEQKKKLRKAWLDQIDKKKIRNEYDKIFQ